MKSGNIIPAIGLLLLSSTLGSTAIQAAPMQVFIPEGSANQVLVVNAETGSTIRTITGLQAVHGLAGAPGVPYLVASSFEEMPKDKTGAVAKPEGVSADEHEAHHKKPAKAVGPQDAGVSILSIVDVKSGEIVRRIEVPGAVHHTAASPDGRFALATHPGGGGISVIDLEKLELSNWIATGPMPSYAVFGDKPGMAYVSNAGNGTVSEIDLERGIVRRNMVAGASPEHLVIDAQKGTLYVADAYEGRVIELSLAQGTASRTFEIGGEIHGIDLTADKTQLFVAGKETDKLARIELGTGKVSTSPLAPEPYHVTTIGDEGTMLVSSRAEPKVWVIDAKTMKPKAEIPISGEGHQMVVLPRR